MCFNDKVYDILKWTAQLLLPALATLYFSLASIWGLPHTEQVIGTITSVNALLGVLLGISTASYKGDGTLIIGNDSVDVIMNEAWEDLAAKKSATLKIEMIEESENTIGVEC